MPASNSGAVIGRRVTSARVGGAGQRGEASGNETANATPPSPHVHRPGGVVAEEYRMGRRWVQVACAASDCEVVLPWRQG